MARQLDKIIVIDIEATCWKDKPPEGQESEIIEVGVSTIDVETKERESKEAILIVPERSEVSDFCTELTTLTAADLEGGVSFREACSILKKKYLTKKRLWVSWGDYDRRQFERQCKSWGVGYPFGPTHLNGKNLFAVQRGLDREVGLDEALKKMDIPLEGTHHRGVDDSWNIAGIMVKILW